MKIKGIEMTFTISLAVTFAILGMSLGIIGFLTSGEYNLGLASAIFGLSSFPLAVYGTRKIEVKK